MSQEPSFLRQQWQRGCDDSRAIWINAIAGLGGQIKFWVLALIVGIIAGFATLLFRLGINKLQSFLYGTDEVYALHSHAASLPWYWIVIIPIVGGLIVGLILNYYTDDGRVRSVSDVIEGAALDEGRVEHRAGIGSALASLITLSTGGSSGREGPVVHMAAVISSKVSKLVKADGITGRDLLGCAVASAVAASFNAPIAGALFALEVILRHFALHAFAPIVIASVAGAVVSRIEFGDVSEFTLPTGSSLQFYAELPAFLILGIICGVVASLFMRGVLFAEDFATHYQRRFNIPRWARPMIAGGVLGGIAVVFPHIIGVGYETTLAALHGELALTSVLIFAVVKAIAAAITVGGRMGGGVFSPALMLGALTGLAFGLIATSLFPQQSGTVSLYALAGMGGVAAAVLGAPISTTLIVFELTGNWQAGLAVMVAISLSTAIGSRLVTRSFFLTQLNRRSIHLAAGPQAYLLGMFRVANLMRPVGDAGTPSDDTCWEKVDQGVYVDGNATLEVAMPIFDRAGATFVPVITLGREDKPPELLGALMQVDALKAYNRALAATAAEEHS